MGECGCRIEAEEVVVDCDWVLSVEIGCVLV